MASTDTIDILECISAMHIQEKRTPRCTNYFQRTTVVDKQCRTAMFNWLCQISDALSLNHETVGLAMSLLDRFLSSCTKSSDDALGDRSNFQLAAITSYYIAVKINEPLQLGLDMLVKLCRGCYEHSAILSMEEDILFSLQWRISAPTPLDFMRQILALLPSTERSIVENAEQNIVRATKDAYFSNVAPSIVGAACIATAFKESNVIGLSSEQAVFWNTIYKLLELDASDEFIKVQQQLKGEMTQSNQFAKVGRSVTSLSKGSISCASSSKCSPVSINVSP